MLLASYPYRDSTNQCVAAKRGLAECRGDYRTQGSPPTT